MAYTSASDAGSTTRWIDAGGARELRAGDLSHDRAGGQLASARMTRVSMA